MPVRPVGEHCDVITSLTDNLALPACELHLDLTANFSSFSVRCHNVTGFAFSALTLLVGRQEGHLACKKYGVMRCWRGYLLSLIHI